MDTCCCHGFINRNQGRIGLVRERIVQAGGKTTGDTDIMLVLELPRQGVTFMSHSRHAMAHTVQQLLKLTSDSAKIGWCT